MRTVRRVLVVNPYGIGDLLFITPVLRGLRLLPGIEKVDLLLGSRTEEIVRRNPHVDEIFTVDKDLYHRQGGLKTFSDVFALGRTLRRNRYDLMLDYSLRSEYAFSGRAFLGIPVCAGFDYKRRGFFHNRRLALPEGFKGRHVADFFCDLAEKAGVPVEDRFLEFYLPPDADEQLVKKVPGTFSRFVVVSPGGGESWGKDAHFKRWPARFFADFLNRLPPSVEASGFVLLGSKGEKPLADEIERGLSSPCANLAGEISLTEAACVISKASLFVGNDGGLVHLAHALRTPVIALYGPVDPVVYGPYPARPGAVALAKEGLECRPCYQSFRYNSACVHRDCLQAFTPEEVFSQLEAKRFFDGQWDRFSSTASCGK